MKEIKEPDYKSFAIAILEQWPDSCEVDMGDIQDLAEKHGLLKPVEMSNPCSENCACDEYYSESDYPITCYKKQWITPGRNHERD